MRKCIKWFAFLLLCLLVGVGGWLNWKYEVFAFHFSGGDGNLKLMTFNIHGAEPTFDGEVVAQLILREDADAVLLNEYCDSTAHVMDSLLMSRYPYSAGSKEGPCADVLYSKWPVSGYTDLGGDTLNTLTHKCQMNVEGKVVWLFLCHLTSNNKEDYDIEDAMNRNTEDSWQSYFDGYKSAQEYRLKEIEGLCENADSVEGMPSVVMGDFNDFSYSRIMEPLVTRGFKDAWWKAGFGYGATYKNRYVRLRIDHIMYNDGLEPTRVKVVDSGRLSDHNALVAEFEFR